MLREMIFAAVCTSAAVISTVIFADDDVMNRKVIDSYRKILNAQTEKYSCKLSEKEARGLVVLYFEKKNITVEAFKEAAKITTLLVKALREVVSDGKDPDEVYKRLRLEDHKITTANWKYYTTGYKTEEKIVALEKMIPDDIEKLIEQSKVQFTPAAEEWLLEQYIISVFDRANPDQVDIEKRQKLRKWWEEVLKEYQLESQEYERVLGTLSYGSTLFSSEDEMMKNYFKDRIAEMTKADTDTTGDK